MALPPTAIHTVKAILRGGPLGPDDLIDAMARKGWADVDLGDLLQLIATRGATAGIWTDGEAISTGTRPRTPVATAKAAGERTSPRERAAAPAPQRPQSRPGALRSLDEIRFVHPARRLPVNPMSAQIVAELPDYARRENPTSGARTSCC